MILRKIKQFAREHGLKALFIKIRLELMRRLKRWIKNETTFQEFLSKTFPLSSPIAFIRVESPLRLNLVVDEIKEEPALIIASLLARQKKCPLRIISKSSVSKPAPYFNFLKTHRIEKPSKVEFFSDHPRFRLETSENDIFAITSEWGEEAIRHVNLRKEFIDLKNCPKAFPPFLYPPTFEDKPKYRLIFRHLDYVTLKLLDEAFVRGILLKEAWEVYFLGEKIPSFTFSNGIKAKQLKLNLMQTIDLGFSLNDPDFALDVVARGGIALTNTPQVHSKNMISASLNQMAEGFSKALALVQNQKKRIENYHTHTVPSDWHELIKEIPHVFSTEI